nr:carcinine hydrolase/isopenicillin-N N-acyltransferase family protein [Roseobacter litoralis]
MDRLGILRHGRISLGLSDSINDAGLSVVLAYGVTTILRYVLETCETVDAALAAMKRIPSHMAYNVFLADAAGKTASIELAPGGGGTIMPRAIATNHQSKGTVTDRPLFHADQRAAGSPEGLASRPTRSCPSLSQKSFTSGSVQSRLRSTVQGGV